MIDKLRTIKPNIIMQPPMLTWWNAIIEVASIVEEESPFKPKEVREPEAKRK